MRAFRGLCFREAKTNRVLHPQAPALHPLARVQPPWTNRGQVTGIILTLGRARGVAGGRPCALYGFAMSKYLKLTLVALLVSTNLTVSAQEQGATWSSCANPMTSPIWNKVMLIHTSITTSGDGQTIYVHSVIDRSQPSQNGMLGRYFFRSRDGGISWSVLVAK